MYNIHKLPTFCKDPGRVLFEGFWSHFLKEIVMEKIFAVVMSHPLEVLVGLMLAGVSIQALGAWIEASPRRGLLVSIMAAMVMMTGCANTPVIRGTVAGGIAAADTRALGGSQDLALGVGVFTGAAVAADAGHKHDHDHDHDHDHKVGGGQRRIEPTARSLPARMTPDKCLRRGLLKLVDSSGVARACASPNNFFHGRARSCQWSDQGGGVWKIAGAWGGDVTPRILQNVKDKGGHIGGCYGVPIPD